MTRDTNKDWSKIAEENPYWGVLSHDSFRGRDIADSKRSEFFASGEEQIARILSIVERHFDPQFKPQRSLDFGCGVGRLLIPLAKRSKEAVGLDVAPRMLELTRQNLAAAGIKNATAIQSDDALSNLSGMFDFINSYIVLQHIPPERGYRIISALLKHLKNGGIGSLQFTYAKDRRFLDFESGRARYFRREGNFIHDLLPSFETAPEGTVTMFDYDLNQFMLQIAGIALNPLLIFPTNDDGHAGVHAIFWKA